MSDIRSYKRKFIAKVTKRSDSFVFLQITKGVAIFVFTVGILSAVQLEGLSKITPIHESSGSEIIVDKSKDKATLVSIQPFLTANGSQVILISGIKKKLFNIPAIRSNLNLFNTKKLGNAFVLYNR